ncbi:phosphate ABC transporter permease subunit PstC [Tychonema sp. BBK16]|uniref:phosphate ABC transporter permease subunit PstC n=1 Tax=Tychonema sp. BBK16 TaxID=2699888 RepID=UPI001F3155EA|nr:phosphate ABC transporter permease subunit PstC [Tychonema sp. BBK16]MCF6371723.1 phosphate ABC transporter permease subunit PstC [Tychonema sp. BBK16]
MTNFAKQPEKFTNQQTANITEVDLTDTKGEGLWMESAFTIFVWGFAIGTAGTLFWMSAIIFKDAWPAVSQFGLSFLWNPKWDIQESQFGALPFIYGTVISSAIAIIIALPLGLSVAIVTSENFLPAWVRSPLGFMVELISAIPSVIVGLWGIFVLIPFLLPLQQSLFNNFSWFPLFSSEPLGPGMLPAGILLSIMILPTVAAISRDVLMSVPVDLRSASMSLGATRWETIFKLLLPAASSGIIGATILALGRALGETMAVTMVIGNSIQINPSILAPAYSIPAVLASQFREAQEPLHIGSLMYLALILFVITLLVNAVAVLFVQLIGVKGAKN